MNRPELVAVYFDGAGPNSAFYARMARVLQYTAGLHCPDWKINIQRIGSTASTYGVDGNHSHVSNTHKLDYWNRAVQAAEDGTPMLLIDGDMMILNSLDEIWLRDFDMAYTVKNAKLPFNGGVVFLRVSSHVKRFMAEWWDRNLSFLNDPVKHQWWRSKYGGMNQASFGSMLPEIQNVYGINLVALPCAEWNCEQSAWSTFDPKFTRIVHIKSGLRKAVFSRGPVTSQVAPLVEIWNRMEQYAITARVPV